MIADIEKDAQARMQKTVVSTKDDMARIRTGRASPALLEHITIDYYGSQTPISQIASVSVQDARTLAIQPWEKQMLSVIERAILESDLGLNPITAGETMRIPLPPMTEERRHEMVKVVKKEGENGKIAIRNVRRDAIGSLRDLEKEKEITQDEQKQAEERLQKLTDTYVAQIDKVVEEKQNEIMEV